MNNRFVKFLDNKKLCAESYSADGRSSIWQLYRECLTLEQGWLHEVIYWQGERGSAFPVLLFRTENVGEAIWVLAGIHGEEPAGPNAIAENINIFKEKKKKNIPMVLIPMCNPAGYFRNWRYPNEIRDSKIGCSVGDLEHLLFNGDLRPRREQPISADADKLTKAVLKHCKAYPPVLSLDLHEDEDKSGIISSYIYSQGALGVFDPVASQIISILDNHEVPIQKNGVTRFGENIINGVVNSLNDGSVDELLAAPKIFKNGKIASKPFSSSVIVVETPTVGLNLEKRIAVHSEILQNLEKLYRLSRRNI